MDQVLKIFFGIGIVKQILCFIKKKKKKSFTKHLLFILCYYICEQINNNSNEYDC